MERKDWEIVRIAKTSPHSPWLLGRFVRYRVKDVRDDNFVESDVILWERSKSMMLHLAHLERVSPDVAAAVLYALETGDNAYALKRHGADLLDASSSLETALGGPNTYSLPLWWLKNIQEALKQARNLPPDISEAEWARRYDAVTAVAKRLTEAEELRFGIKQ